MNRHYPKVALITGVRRIGFYVAQYLLSNGYSLAILYRSAKRQVDELQIYARNLETEVLPFEVDLSDYETYKSIPQKVFEHFGRLDLLLNVASPFGKSSVLETEKEDLEYYYRAIVESAFFLSKESYKFMLENPGEVKGRIVNFGDWATVVGNPYPNFAPYLVAKGALDTLTKVLAVEFAPFVLVNEIALGPVLPPSFEGKEKTENWERYIKEKTLLKKPVAIEDILSAVDFFIKAKSVTGEILVLDSGQRFVGKGYS
jgi:pteridine reductase